MGCDDCCWCHHAARPQSASMLSRRPCVWNARVVGLSWPGGDPWTSWDLALLWFASLWALQALKVLAAISRTFGHFDLCGGFHGSFPDVAHMLLQREAGEWRLHPCAHPVHEISGSILILTSMFDHQRTRVGRRMPGSIAETALPAVLTPATYNRLERYTIFWLFYFLKVKDGTVLNPNSPENGLFLHDSRSTPYLGHVILHTVKCSS